VVQKKFDNFTLFNSRSESQKHEFGCRIYVRGEFLEYVKDFKLQTKEYVI